MDFWDQSLLADAPSLPNLIVLRTLSKAWGAAGVRLGFAACCPQLLGALNTARSPYNLSSLSQLLGRLLLEQQPCLGAFLGGQAQKLEKQLRCILPGADVFSTCTNFVYLETADAQEIFGFLKEQGIIVRLFGTGALRITASLDQELKALYAALQNYMEAKK